MSNHSFTPIPTTYKGVTFKSKTEATFARTLDLMGFCWQYEPPIPDGFHPPDFLISYVMDGKVINEIIELKPSEPTATVLETYRKRAVLWVQGFQRDACVVIANMMSGEIYFYQFSNGEWLRKSFGPGTTNHWQTACNYRFDLK